jgi:hypothetical protein
MRRNHRRGLNPTVTALLFLAALVILVYLGFTKAIPFQSHYEVEAVVKTTNQIKRGSPVRIAGVDVGKVMETSTAGNGQEAARIRMRILDKGRPIHKDATLKIRPRILLEGNFFVDLQPGSPSAPEMARGETIPIQNTAGPVQFDQVLSVFEGDTPARTCARCWPSCARAWTTAAPRRSTARTTTPHRRTAARRSSTTRRWASATATCRATSPARPAWPRAWTATVRSCAR